MKYGVVASLLVIMACGAGCTITMTGSAKWSDVDSVVVDDNKELISQNDRLLAETRAFVSEISAASGDIDDIHAVLKKYGIERK